MAKKDRDVERDGDFQQKMEPERERECERGGREDEVTERRRREREMNG